LCVDDDAHVVEAIVLHLRKHYQVSTALSGHEGLKTLLYGGAPHSASGLLQTIPRLEPAAQILTGRRDPVSPLADRSMAFLALRSRTQSQRSQGL
jgi:hypothetical protein